MQQLRQNTRHFVYLLVGLTVLLMVSCITPPPSTVNQPNPIQPQSNAQTEKSSTNFKIKNETPEPQTLTFPSLVPNQTLSTTSLPSGSSQQLNFITESEGSASSNTILMPDNGQFQVTFQSGSTFSVIDNDARDGSATVQMPTGVLDGYLRLEGQASTDTLTRKITYADGLYYVSQEINRGSFTPDPLCTNPLVPSLS